MGQRRDIQGYEGRYTITDCGTVISSRGNIVLSPSTNNRGYKMVCLTNDEGFVKNCTIHRLVALTFIPNPDNKPYVNHIDGDKTNNRVDNLEWVTGSENIQHAINKGLIKRGVNSPRYGLRGKLSSNKISIIDTETGKKYHTIKEASLELKICYTSLSQMLNGKRRNKTNLRYA